MRIKKQKLEDFWILTSGQLPHSSSLSLSLALRVQKLFKYKLNEDIIKNDPRAKEEEEEKTTPERKRLCLHAPIFMLPKSRLSCSYDVVSDGG